MAEFVIAVAGSLKSNQYNYESPSSTEAAPTVNDAVSYFESTSFFEEMRQGVDCGETQVDYVHVTSGTICAFNTSTFYQICVLAERDMLNKVKDPYATVTDLVIHVMVSLFYGSIYYKLDSTQYQERLCILFFSLIFTIMGHQKQMPVIIQERLLYYRERSAGAYGPLSYWLTSIFNSIPFIVVNVFLYAITVHQLAGLRSGTTYFLDFYTTLLLMSFTGMFSCRAIAALAPSEQAAINLFPAMIQFLMAFAGFGIFLPVMQDWLAVWAPYITFVRSV